MAFADGPCRKLVRERVLRDMLGAVVDPVGSGWKVLVMDSFTTHIMSSTLRMSDLLDAGDTDQEHRSTGSVATAVMGPQPGHAPSCAAVKKQQCKPWWLQAPLLALSALSQHPLWYSSGLCWGLLHSQAV